MTQLYNDYVFDGKKPEETEMRACYCEVLIKEAMQNENIVVIDVDTSYSMGTQPFYKAFPERAINCGIMEANGIGVAAGLSSVGFIPFFHAFGIFASRRCFDQVFISCAFQDLNVKIIGADAGVTAMVNGGTHMPFEDIGIMRNIPGMTVIEPADTAMIPYAVRHMANTWGNFYMRYGRRKMMRVYKEGVSFEIGKANILKEGDDVAIVACGIMVREALEAAKTLSEEGIGAMVIDMHTIKPIDSETIIRAAKKCGALVTCENHNVINGLGSAVAEVLCENMPVPMERIGVFESFGEVGTQEYLMKRFGLTAGDIYTKAKKAIARRKSA
jgi:transketolase